MGEVWLVWEASGEWSDFHMAVESVWDTEAGAVSHIVRDLGAALAGGYGGEPHWELVGDDPDWPETYDYTVERARVRHGG